MPIKHVMRYVLAYDVTDDGRRSKLAKMLLDYGHRVQKSVFEAELTREEAQELLMRVANYLDIGDTFGLYPLCKTCTQNIEYLGRHPESLSVAALRII